jgi:N-methylhydantoinase A
MYTLGIDIGGTFTDFTLKDEKSRMVQFDKEPTTTDNPAIGALEGSQRILDDNDVEFKELQTIVHGTTLVSNTLIEQTGAKTGLISTDGSRDILEMRRGYRYDIFDFQIEYPEPLVPRQRRIEVDERVDASGEILTPLEEEEIREVVSTLVDDHDVESIGVSLLHSYATPDHEQQIGQYIADEYPSISVSLSSEVAPIIREYERTSTTASNAYVAPTVEDYLDFLETEFQNRGFDGVLYMMSSSGGLIDTTTAKNEPIQLIESGPAAGVLANRIFGEEQGIENIFSFDMGGTTAKGSIIRDGNITMTQESDIARVHRFKKGSGRYVMTPMIDITEIGAGGGSIAKLTDVGLEVGPESAGSDPGPICYGRGGREPTITDAALLLGYLNPEKFFGGRMDLATKETERLFREKIADPLDVSVVEAAWRVFELVNENMTNAFRQYASDRGIDTREVEMAAVGGAGPMQAFRVAKKLDIEQVICPNGAGVGSAIGLVQAPKSYTTTRTQQAVLSNITDSKLVDVFSELAEEAETVLRRADVDIGETEANLSLDMRHINQGHEIRVQLPDQDIETVTIDVVKERFRENYQNMFNRDILEYPIEIMNFRIERSEAKDSDRVEKQTEAERSASVDERDVYFGHHGHITANTYGWQHLEEGQTIDGPAVIEGDRTSAVVDPESSFTIKQNRNIVINMGGAQ